MLIFYVTQGLTANLHLSFIWSFLIAWSLYFLSNLSDISIMGTKHSRDPLDLNVNRWHNSSLVLRYFHLTSLFFPPPFPQMFPGNILSLCHGGGVHPWGLPVRDVAPDGWLSTRGPMFDGGLQGVPEKPGSPLPEPGGGSTLGPWNPNTAGEGGEYDPERETWPISFSCSFRIV